MYVDFFYCNSLQLGNLDYLYCIRFTAFMLMFELICVKVAQPVPGWLINRDNWKKRLDGVEIGEEDMKVIVMNFLVVEGYVEVAEAFRLATGTNRIH